MQHAKPVTHEKTEVGDATTREVPSHMYIYIRLDEMETKPMLYDAHVLLIHHKKKRNWKPTKQEKPASCVVRNTKRREATTSDADLTTPGKRKRKKKV